MFNLSKEKVKSKYILSSGRDYEIALETERNLLEVLIVECVSWLVATIVNIVFFCLYVKFVCPDVWSYIVMNKSSMASIALTIAVFVFAIYFGYNNYQEKKQLQKDKAELFGKIEQLNQSIAKNNQIIAQREQEKAQDAMSIKQLQEQMKDALKNNQCANDFMPSNVSDWMRNGKN